MNARLAASVSAIPIFCSTSTGWSFRTRAIGDVVAAAQAAGFQGLNVTHPFKQSVIPVLDALSSEASAIGAVNTIVFGGDRMEGHNTDSWGFAESFRESMSGAPLDCVAMFGAGGAGAAVAYALMELGVVRLTIVDSDASRASILAARMGAVFGNRVAAYPDPAAAVGEASGIVNTTPVGMAKYPGTPFDIALLAPEKWVADIIYFPAETELLRTAPGQGLPDAARHRHGDLPGRPRLRTVHRPQGRSQRNGGSLRGRGMNAMTPTLRIECVVENRRPAGRDAALVRPDRTPVVDRHREPEAAVFRSRDRRARGGGAARHSMPARRR